MAKNFDTVFYFIIFHNFLFHLIFKYAYYSPLDFIMENISGPKAENLT